MCVCIFFFLYSFPFQISTGGARTKKAVYWQGGIHAREWVSPATVMYITKSVSGDLWNAWKNKSATLMLR